MKKKDILKKLAALGEKDVKGKTVPELRSLLAKAEADGSKPGRNIHKGPQPGDPIGRTVARPS